MTKYKDLIFISIIIILIGLCAQFYYSYQYLPAHQITVYYNHDIQANEKIISVIDNADMFVYFAIYTFTRQDIRDALLAAHRRGLNVRGITDREQSENLDSQKKIIDALREAGIPILVQDHSALMHIKTVVTDKGYASGSYNWTASATDRNDEVLEVGTDEQLRKQYQAILEEVFAKYE